MDNQSFSIWHLGLGLLGTGFAIIIIATKLYSEYKGREEPMDQNFEIRGWGTLALCAVVFVACFIGLVNKLFG